MESSEGGDVQDIEARRVVEVEGSGGVSIGATVESNIAPNAIAEKEQDLQHSTNHPDQNKKL